MKFGKGRPPPKNCQSIDLDGSGHVRSRPPQDEETAHSHHEEQQLGKAANIDQHVQVFRYQHQQRQHALYTHTKD